MKINNKHKGFTLIEYVMAIVLTLSLTLLISKISIGFIYTMKSASVNISQRENAQVIEKIIKSELESDSYISSIYIKDIGNVKAEAFTQSDILVLYYKTKKSTGSSYNINAVNFIKDKNKIFIRKNLFKSYNKIFLFSLDIYDLIFYFFLFTGICSLSNIVASHTSSFYSLFSITT